MRFKTIEHTKCDVLIIGGGGAGLRAAIAAAESGVDVLMVSKVRIGQATNTILSKAIIAASGWGDAEDSSRVHGADTLQSGRELNDPAIVQYFTDNIRAETQRLQEWGVEFVSDDNQTPMVVKLPGHRYARHIVGKNWQGKNLVLPLKKKAVESGVRFEEGLFVSSLVVVNNRICGATCISEQGRFLAVQAKAVILATGGFGHLYMNTNNVPGITGDGQALAATAGVDLQDMEFVQFYPTTLGQRGRRILLYERILVQDGVVLRNGRGENILEKHGYPNPAEITRDQLAQAIMKEILADPEQNGTVAFDLRGLSADNAVELSALLPPDWAAGEGVLQVTPTAHFCMGGVVVDNTGKTSCAGLYAAGEVTAGAHGANRLGGNALAEAIVMGARVGTTAAAATTDPVPAEGFDAATEEELNRLNALFNPQGQKPADLIEALKKNMWFNAGIIRNQDSLNEALKTINELTKAQVNVTSFTDLLRLLEFRNMGLIGEMVGRSALERTETRGAHFRTDYPVDNNAEWLLNIRISRTDDGLVLKKVRVNQQVAAQG